MKENCLQAKIKWKTKSWMEIQVVLKFYHWAETMLWFWVWHVSELIISSMILLWDMQLQAHMNILKRLKDRKDKLWCLVSYLNDNSIIKMWSYCKPMSTWTAKQWQLPQSYVYSHNLFRVKTTLDSNTSVL